MNNRFSNKIALVTGAAQGIGRRVCERLLNEGAQVDRRRPLRTGVTNCKARAFSR